METPQLKVSRSVSACARCRNAKTKCDGVLPACTACKKAGKAGECSSVSDEFAKGKERSFVASLESRIDKLRKQLAECQRGQRPAQDSNNHEAISSLATNPRVEKGTRRKEASDVDELVSDFGYLSVNATASGYHGFTQEMSFARLVLSTACVGNMPQATKSPLPPRETAISLVDECINRVFVLYPVLSEASIFGSLEATYQREGRYCPPQDCWNARMVLAISSLFRSRAIGDVQYQTAVSHAAAALEQREAVFQPGSVVTVQSILLLVIYSMLDPLHFNCWYLIGLAARVMVDIGVHQEPPKEARMKSNQLESRRRIFYCVYVLDRAITLTFVRGFSFTDDSVNVLLPMPVAPSLTASFTAPYPRNLVDPALELIKYRQVQSSAYQTLFLSRRSALSEPWQSRIALLNRVQDWLNTMPRGISESFKTMILAEMFYISILLLRPPGGNQNLDPYGNTLFLEYAVGFVQNTWLMSDRSWNLSYCTNIDLLRITSVGEWLLDVLEDHRTSIFSNRQPKPPSVPYGATLPVVKTYDTTKKIAQAMNAIKQIDQVIMVLGSKFGLPHSYHSFRTKSAAILETLEALPEAKISHPSVDVRSQIGNLSNGQFYDNDSATTQWHEAEGGSQLQRGQRY